MSNILTYQERLLLERNEYVARLARLEGFIASDDFAKEDAVERGLLVKQREQTAALLDTCEQRIARFSKPG